MRAWLLRRDSRVFRLICLLDGDAFLRGFGEFELDDGLREIAAFAEDVNTRTENIGARRLHTIMEKILADISFDASEKRGSTLVIDREHVVAQLADVRADAELSRFIL